uniref:protein PHLOEM PROTEIN 2-LIKE A1-like n=1 Tax=Erigeron canadensis TaxID=72917 RepID=UPI001CB93670|nr:protein PHLOEM PROTEIN 2-LIKE A1-like [Erigeron canadensis]
MRSKYLSQEAAHTQQQSAISPTETASQNHENRLDTNTTATTTSSGHADVILNKNEKKNQAEKASSGNCFMVFARDITISFGDVPRYWQWPRVNETSDTMVEVAELRDVCWLQLVGKFEMGRLTPGIKYEVVFVVMIKAYNYGWYQPINIKLTLPDGSTQKHTEDFNKKPRSKWFEIRVGEFIVDAKKGGCVEFTMYEHGGHWKRGLVVKGVSIRPKF